MRPDGVELIARWRETGAWWAGDQPVEIAEWRDRRGVKRRATRKLPVLSPDGAQREHKEDSTEELALRPRKMRDEKFSRVFREQWRGVRRKAEHPYAPLHVLSGYSFGRSTLFARELARRAADLGLPALALVDRFALTGAVEFSREAQECGVKPLIGATLELEQGGEIVLIARSKQGYTSLSQLITACHLEEPRLFPLCNWERLERFSQGLLCLTGGDSGPVNRLLLRGRDDEARSLVQKLAGLYGRDDTFVEIDRSYLPWEITVNRRLLQIAESLRLMPVAGGAVTHARPEDFPAQDVHVCAETLCTVEEIIGRKPQRDDSQAQVKERPLRSMNAEKHLRSPADMAYLYSDRPILIENTLRVAERCGADVLPERTRLPQLFDDPPAELQQLVYSGANDRYDKVTEGLKRRIDGELERIARLGYSGHFLTAWDFCTWARGQDIQFSGRGSVVDSVVSFCLGFSRIDAYSHDLHFDRFLPDDGSKRPDIDIDFEARRRDDVRNYVIAKYGAERTATVSAIGAFCTRGIVREVGKALGLSSEAIGYLAKRIHGGVPPSELESALQTRPELRDSGIDKNRLHWIMRLGQALCDVPRNMRAHSSGVVISDRPLAETVPVQWSGGLQNDGRKEEGLRIIQWDKRSAKHYFDKFDILCLRGQDVLSGTEGRVRLQDSGFQVDRLPIDDEETYRAMRSGELIGVPQSASPAMRQAHMRLRTTDIHDASLVQAGIRPGVGGAVKINELIARRRGTKPYRFEHPDLEKILAHTYGIVVFQEQIDQLLTVFAGYSSGEAEEIREEIHKRRREDYGLLIHDEVVSKMLAKGYGTDVSEHAFDLIAGFKGYGFAQGHALAFAEISVRSIWCQQNYPAEYFAALLDAQPAGYYGPCTLVNEARSRGVSILPVDVNASTEQHEVEDVLSEQPMVLIPNGGIRLSLKCVKSLSSETRERAVAAQPYTSFFDFVRRALPARDELDQLVLCGAFDSLHENRRALMWATPSALAYAKSYEGPLKLGSAEPELNQNIEDFTDAEKAIRERAVLGLDIKQHLMAIERGRVTAKGGITTAEGRRLKDGERAMLVGNPIRLRFPPTPSGRRVVFFDLEDETGLLNVTCFDRTYRKYGHAFVCSPYVTLIGHAQHRDGCTAFLIERAYPYSPLVSVLADRMETPVKASDFLVG